jgi:hypothetical protein
MTVHARTLEATSSTEYLPDSTGKMIPYVGAPQCRETITERVTGAVSVSCGGAGGGGVDGVIESQRATSMWDKKYGGAPCWQLETTVVYAADSLSAGA